MCKRDLCWSLAVPLWQRGLTCRVLLRLIKVAENLLVVVYLPVLLTLERRGDSIPDVLQSTTSSSSSSSVVQIVTSPILYSVEAHRGLCLMWFGVTIFSLCLILPFSVISCSSILMQLQLSIPLSRRK